MKIKMLHSVTQKEDSLMNFSMIFGLIEMAVGLFLILCFYVLHKKEWIFGIPITLSGILLILD